MMALSLQSAKRPTNDVAYKNVSALYLALYHANG